MSRTHHARRLWRLSCGCLREYPGMSLGRVHHVLCVACRTAVKTLYPYEERRCGFTATARRAEDNKVIHASCTQGEGNEQCAQGKHYDRNVQMYFQERGKLRASNEGHTGSL